MSHSKTVQPAAHEELFASLRELLQQTPSEELWEELTGLLDQWQDPDVLREVVVPYAQEHLALWDDQLRATPLRWVRSAQAQLRREAPDDGLFSLGRKMFHTRDETKQDTLALIRSPHFSLYTHLHIQVSKLTSKELKQLTTAQSTSKLTSLSLGYSGITDKMLDLIASAPWRLTALMLPGNELSDQAIAALLSSATLSGLKSLKLSNIRTVGAQTIGAIVDNQLPLEVLDLSSCSELTAEELRALVQSKSFHLLKELKLRSTSINPYSADEPNALGTILSEAPQTPSLKHLDLSFSNVTNGDMLLLSDWEGFAQIEELELSYHTIKDTGVEAMVTSPYLGQLKKLDVSCAQELTDQDFARLLQAPWLNNINKLRLWSCDICADRASLLSACTPLPQLTELCLWENPLQLEGLQQLLPTETFPNLKILDLSECHLGDDGVEYLAKTAWPHQLTNLSLEKNELTAAGAKAILKSNHYPRLRHLDLSENKLHRAFRALPKTSVLSRLEELYLNDADLRPTDIEDLCKALRHNTQLKELDLSTNPSLGTDSLLALLREPFVQHLQSLSLNSCNIGNLGAEELLRAAPKALLVVDLHENPIDDPALITQLNKAY